MKQKIGIWDSTNGIYLERFGNKQRWTIEKPNGEIIHEFKSAEEIGKWIYYNWCDYETGVKKIKFLGKNKVNKSNKLLEKKNEQ